MFNMTKSYDNQPEFHKAILIQESSNLDHFSIEDPIFLGYHFKGAPHIRLLRPK